MIDLDLLEMLPPLRRARGDRLYGGNQQHWVDLWKQDGIWILGHRPEGAAKEWKNQVDKGLSTWAPSLWPRRLEPLVKQILPGITAVRVFRNADRAASFLGDSGAVAASLWRPWSDSGEISGKKVVWPVLPTGPGQAVALAFGAGWAGPLPPHDVVSPADAAGLVHAAAQIIRFTADPKAEAARKETCTAFDRYLGPSGLFHRQGIWFEILAQPQEYKAVFKAHFDAGFLLNPDPVGMGIIPVQLSDGEWTAWRKAAETWKGGGS